MCDGFQYTEKHQANADAGGEQHCQPRRVIVMRPCAASAETHRAEFGKCDRDTDDHEQIGGNDEKPVELRRNPNSHRAEKNAG